MLFTYTPCVGDSDLRKLRIRLGSRFSSSRRMRRHWRTLIGNRSAGNELPCPANYADLYRQFLDQDVRDQHLQSLTTIDTTLFQQAMRQAVAISEDGPCREFTISSQGLLSLGPPHSQPGG